VDTRSAVLVKRTHGTLHQSNLNRPTIPPWNNVELLDFASTTRHNWVAMAQVS
jgi:hypothetical protein